jgi:hypothetical protein
VIITATGVVPSTGLVYVTVHLDYGLKTMTGYGKTPDPTYTDYYYAKGSRADGVPGTRDDVDILYLTEYKFSYKVGAGFWEPSVWSENVFKKDPGIGGFVKERLNSGDLALVPGAWVHITGPNVDTYVKSDEDGWYMFSYKYTGKAAPFTLTVYNTKVSTTVTIKANSYAQATDLVVPTGFVPTTPPTMASKSTVFTGGSGGSGTAALLAGFAAMIVSCILVGILVSSCARSFFTLKAPRTRTLRHSGRSAR